MGFWPLSCERRSHAVKLFGLRYNTTAGGSGYASMNQRRIEGPHKLNRRLGCWPLAQENHDTSEC